MRILFVVPYVPNLIRVRPYNFLRFLSRRGNEIQVYTVSSDPQDQEDIAHLKDFCQQVRVYPMPRWRSFYNSVRAIPTSLPLQSVYSYQPEMARDLQNLAKSQVSNPSIDVMHVEHLRGARYGLFFQDDQWQSKAFPLVWDSVDSIGLLFRQASSKSRRWINRWLTRFELRRSEAYEGWLSGQFNRVLVTSPDDQRALLDYRPANIPAIPVEVLPNGVDLDYFREDASISRQEASLVVSGKMSYHANISMVMFLFQDIMPKVWACRPDVRLIIVGKDPPRDITALSDHPRVSVTGTIPDIRPYLCQATLSVAPLLYGTGIQNKVLEAMACATPVITTSKAVSALQAKPGRELLTADSADLFADTILHALEDHDLQHQIGQAGRKYVEIYHDWEKIAARLEQIYQEEKQKLLR